MVKARCRRGQGKVEREGQGKINVRLNQSNHNHNYNYSLMGFDKIEINLVLLVSRSITLEYSWPSKYCLGWGFLKLLTERTVNGSPAFPSSMYLLHFNMFSTGTSYMVRFIKAGVLMSYPCRNSVQQSGQTES